MFMKCLLLAIAVLAPSMVVQDDAESVKQLVGTNKKEWVYERFEQYMGDKNRCKKGESWIFYKEGKVEVKKCESERTVVAEKHWKLQRKSVLDVAVTIDGTEYLVLFPPAVKPKERMILRTKADVKTGATKDIVFSREVE